MLDTNKKEMKDMSFWNDAHWIKDHHLDLTVFRPVICLASVILFTISTSIWLLFNGSSP